MLGTSTEHAPVTFRKAVSDTIAGVKGFKGPPSGEDEADPSHLLIKGLAPEIDPWQVEPVGCCLQRRNLCEFIWASTRLGNVMTNIAMEIGSFLIEHCDFP